MASKKRPALRVAEVRAAYGRDAFVLDASVAVKWYVPHEADAGKALWVWRQFESGALDLAAPFLLQLELANALRYLPGSSREWAGGRIAAFSRLSLSWHVPDPRLMEAASDLVWAHGVEIYDAFYLALAQRLSTRLLTADEKFIKKVGNHPLLMPLRTLVIPTE